jgi:hypothetical protein
MPHAFAFHDRSMRRRVCLPLDAHYEHTIWDDVRQLPSETLTLLRNMPATDMTLKTTTYIRL